jgi:hypothetical protein
VQDLLVLAQGFGRLHAADARLSSLNVAPDERPASMSNG